MGQTCLILAASQHLWILVPGGTKILPGLLSGQQKVSQHQKPTPPAVFNLQALDWIHCEEETGAYYRLSWHTYKLIIFFFCKFLKLFIFPKKICAFQKIP